MDAATYQIAHRISAEALAKLRALSPSESGRLDEIFSLMEQQTDVLGQIADAASAGDSALVDSMIRELVDLTHAKDNRGGPDFWNCPISLPA